MQKGLSNRPTHELADIIQRYEPLFLANYPVLKHHQRVLNALKICRTQALGGHLDQCTSCQHVRISYNSCRNRHCPKCQNTAKEKWIMAREADLLPCRYFHVVFTLPQELHAYCLSYPKAVYDLLFEASKETLMAFGDAPRFLGGQMGFISLLHTWGQNLSLHPHVHIIVPGICHTSAGFWKKATKNSRYLFPVKAMATVYKHKFMDKLLSFLKEVRRTLPSKTRRELYTKNWVVYAKAPFAGPQQVIEYLGRYTHKIAISNHRLISMDEGRITFIYKDYADQGKQKRMSLEANEFLRRFCLHILPPGFRKIRHYGFLSSRGKAKIKDFQFKNGTLSKNKKGDQKTKADWKDISRMRLGYDPEACPCCKTGKMRTIHTFAANAPPSLAHYVTHKSQPNT